MSYATKKYATKYITCDVVYDIRRQTYLKTRRIDADRPQLQITRKPDIIINCDLGPVGSCNSKERVLATGSVLRRPRDDDGQAIV